MKKSLLLLAAAIIMLPSFGAPARKAEKKAAPRIEAKAHSRAASDLSHTVIYEIPEGEAKQYSSAFSGYALDFNTFSYAPTYNAGFATEITYCDNDVVYLRNFFGITEMATFNYIEGKLQGNKITIPCMTCVGGFNDEDEYEPIEDWTFGEDGTYVYLTVMKQDDELEDEINFVVDNSVSEITLSINEDGSIMLDLPEGLCVGECYETGEWLGYTMDADILTPFDEIAIEELPEGITAEKWVLSGAADARFVDVAIDGDVIYIGNIDSEMPAYIKGTIDGTKVTIPSNQYIGIQSWYNFYTYIVGGVYSIYEDPITGEAYEDYVRIDEITFLYDAENKTLTGNENEGLFVNLGSADYIYYLAMYAPASIKWQNPEAKLARPRNPIITDCYYDDWFEFYVLDFDLPKTDINGNLLNVENMYYNFYRDDEVFTFYADEYITLYFDDIEEMTDVPYTYSDPFDYYIIGGEGVQHSLAYFFEGAQSIGLKLYYMTEDGEVLASDYVGTELSSIKQVQNASEVVSTEYFDITGKKMANPANGFCIKVETMKDGSVKATKILRNR